MCQPRVANDIDEERIALQQFTFDEWDYYNVPMGAGAGSKTSPPSDVYPAKSKLNNHAQVE